MLDRKRMEEPLSPCNKICRIDEATGWCKGCARTLEEIVSWPTAGAEERRVILTRTVQRSLSDQ